MESQLAPFMQDAARIRNICVVAHVDHGKTTITDSLIASNGIISARQAGSLRYMDSRDDEQDRGITMKSSSISLAFRPQGADAAPHLVNLIDSPGHIDFSADVSTAVRLCDGAVLVVDVVEGVCVQTITVMRQAWREKLRPVLVLNKIDRLAQELRMRPDEAFDRLVQIIQEVNAQAATIANELHMETINEGTEEDPLVGYFEFSPVLGNVAFASGVDGWAFRLNHFAAFYEGKLGIDRKLLQKTMWTSKDGSPYYFYPKTKRILATSTADVKGEGGKVKRQSGKPTFIHFVLDSLWHVYESVCNDTGGPEATLAARHKVVKTLKLDVPARDVKHQDPKVAIHSIMSRWLPLSETVLNMVVSQLPSPVEAQAYRMPLLCPQHVGTGGGEAHDAEATRISEAIVNCASGDDEPTVVFVSKMFAVTEDMLPRTAPLLVCAIRPRTRQPSAAPKPSASADGAQPTSTADAEAPTPVPAAVADTATPAQAALPAAAQPQVIPAGELGRDRFVGFARVFSGTLRCGDRVCVCGPKHDPPSVVDVTEVTVTALYLMMGRYLEALQSVPAGSIFGIGGVTEVVHRSATISSSGACRAFGVLQNHAVSIMQVAIEPESPAQLPMLVAGLKLLCHADPSAEYVIQQNGQNVLMCCGEVHLQLCVKDLQSRFARVSFAVSEPIVPLRETLLADASDAAQTFEVTTPSGEIVLSVSVRSLPSAATAFLEQSAATLRKLVDARGAETEASKEFARELTAVLAKESEQLSPPGACAWSFGPRGTGSNMLFSRIAGHKPRGSFVPEAVEAVEAAEESDEDAERFRVLMEIDNSIVTGFQLATAAGPLCEEPLTGVAFVVESIAISGSVAEGGAAGGFSGQLITAMRDGCRIAFRAGNVRLAEPLYSCQITVSTDALGKAYGVLSRRRAQILCEDVKDGTPLFIISARLPVVESFGFTEELRKETSGAATPNLVFDQWALIDQDPFWVPKTEEERQDFGEAEDYNSSAHVDGRNFARALIDKTRVRKGLWVEKQVVQHAEKQRTMARKR